MSPDLADCRIGFVAVILAHALNEIVMSAEILGVIPINGESI
jgi:hypothetical protein